MQKQRLVSNQHDKSVSENFKQIIGKKKWNCGSAYTGFLLRTGILVKKKNQV